MSQSVNVNFRMDAQLKKNVEEICQRMGMNLTTALTICCKKIEQERRIPFDVTADPDPFYSESNMRYLEGIARDVARGQAHFAEHELVEAEE